jgi:acyl carrier protein
MSTPAESEIYQKVTGVVADILKVDAAQITPQSTFTNDLGADSLDTVTLLMALEDEFDQQISDEEAEGLTSIAATVDFIQKKMQS